MSSTPPREWDHGGGAKEEAELARTLKEESGRWFLKFVERFLDADVDVTGKAERERVTGMMSQIKNVNDWLEEFVMEEGDGGGRGVPEETIGRIRRKIYEYLLNHVESAAVALGNGSRDRQGRR